ncbi:SDR family oxidoreductase [Pseudotamlana carrageenivorans]|uniref:D-mannonate oxidoreductase n=1 Tax=Pseudotamlana carrageenivorans TaxID=2069432 RepID=A0A2I7SF67_9FLAO|nr:SDR family oxidoreductase [Tamlana carrageenivorans]AUS04528.1 D-mannonate oxidoreductase [Tamlana carrageenivorans]
MNLFNLKDQVILITGAAGVLGNSMAGYLLTNGATVIVLHYKQKTVDETVNDLKTISDKVDGFVCNVVDKVSLQEVCDAIMNKYQKIDVLINAAGGNMPGATIGPDQSFFDIDMDDFKKVVDLNLFGSIVPSIVFGKEMVKKGTGVIINISSMASDRAITRVAGYSASKAAIDNYTKWLSVELATKYGDGLRVNAIAPGFFIGKQNRTLLLKDDGTFTDRGHTIIQNTPMKRFGEANELHGAVHFLSSDASKFVTGIVIPVDGGFSAFSGV